jgi:homoserine kinase
VHQPYRAPLIPGFEEILALQEQESQGLLGICLSGAGPSILAFADSNLSQIYRRIEAVFQKHGVGSRAFELEADNQGRTIS